MLVYSGMHSCALLFFDALIYIHGLRARIFMGSIQKVYLSCLFISLVLSSLNVLAEQPDAGQVLRQQQIQKPGLPERLPKSEKAQTNPVVSEKVKVEEARVHVKAFHFKGAEGLASDQLLQHLVAGSVGKSLTFSELQQQVQQVTDYFKRNGFFLARAYLPKQDVTAGTVEIAVVQGKLQAGAKVSGHNLRMKPAQLQAIAQAAISADAAVRMQDLERAVLIMNELPGIAVRSQLAAGDQPETTQWMLDATEGPLVTSNVWADNYGNRYTGAGRVNARISLNDPKERGDQLSLGLTSAANLRSEQLDYTLPVGAKGLSAHLGYSHLSFNVGEELANINSTGSAQTKTVGFTYPLIRSRALNLWASGGYDWKYLKDKSAGVVTRNKQIGVVNLGLSGNNYDTWGGGGLNNFSLTFAGGNLDLSNVADDLAIDSSTAGTNGGYAKMNYSLARLQHLTSKLAFFSALNGQYTGQNLDSSEKFILGGSSGVRAYPSGEGSGDRGEIINFELRYDLPDTHLSGWGNWQLVSFFDAGQITLYDSPWAGSVTNISGDNSYILKGAGLGLNLTHQANYSVRTAWARQIGSNPGRSTAGLNSDGLSHKNTFWLQALAWF